MALELLLSTSKLLLQVYATKAFVDRTMQPVLQSSFVRSVVFIVLVVVLMNSMAIIAMALTVHLAAVAYFWMQPGNVVPIIDAERYELLAGTMPSPSLKSAPWGKQDPLRSLEPESWY